MSDSFIAWGNTRAAILEMSQTDDAHHIVGIDEKETNAKDVEDLIASLDRKISQTEGAYSKIKYTLYKLPTFYAVMQVGILSAVFSAEQSNVALMHCKDLWGPLALSVIASGGVVAAVLGKYFKQFRLLKRGRRLIQERILLVGHPSGISLVDLKEQLDDLDINSNYWRWTAERAVVLVTLVTFSICFWHSCKTRLLCQ